MGPNLLVDKSTIQGLNSDEIHILCRYYRIIISPIFIRELSSDLAKEDYGKEELEHRLQILANKANSSESEIIIDEKALIYNDLLYGPIPMNYFTIPRTGGKIVKDMDGSVGIFFDEQIERKILRNWAKGIFSQEDFEKAKTIRTIDIKDDLEKWQEFINERKTSNFDNLNDLIRWVDEEYLSKMDSNNILLLFVLKYLDLDMEHGKEILDKWKSNQKSTLKKSAPYAFFFCRIIFIFLWANLNNLIQTTKNNKNHLDLQYLFYLPFSHAFTSGDNFLKDISIFFMHDDQRFIDLKELKNDLQLIADFFKKQSIDEKKAFNEEYGMYPPELKDSITVNLWKRLMKPKPAKAGIAPEISEEEINTMKRRLKSIIDAGNIQK